MGPANTDSNAYACHLVNVYAERQLPSVWHLCEHVHVLPFFHGNRAPLADPSARVRLFLAVCVRVCVCACVRVCVHLRVYLCVSLSLSLPVSLCLSVFVLLR